MTESSQNPGPTKGGNTVSVVGSGGRRRDDSDSHQCPISFSLSRSVLAESSPQGNFRLCPPIPCPSAVGSALAAISHSASVGRRRFAQRQKAFASYQFTCNTGKRSSSGTTSSKLRRNH